ncbi:MAG: hypothetical protein L3J97_01885 [Thermoplasmata archaeon]|nr:hypothetical protein [Thermoplasmata archaeon]
MSAVATSSAAPSAPIRNSISIPYVVGASVLAGLGLLALQLWIITFEWIYFLGVLPVLFGALMLFHRYAGSNSAE